MAVTLSKSEYLTFKEWCLRNGFTEENIEKMDQALTQLEIEFNEHSESIEVDSVSVFKPVSREALKTYHEFIQAGKIWFKCPFCNAKISATFYSLKMHVVTQHTENKCPICYRTGFKRLLGHLSNEANFCSQHMVAYALFRNAKIGSQNKLYDICRSVAYRKCQILFEGDVYE